ncbi:endocuticle structural glycoprotein SgAbd-5-like isoform X2 [Spodoptera frugiperda]|uniref:Endocuticle structural glycoprotein SgAbd-5-like isoform X2 n=1 Tax=Spodoptera frugiperda TaxID=7108 RepID=A0A9R0EDR7_SPOFR|nr:endocuticle structural glycoprotein SgAbd-5-like isoform X2 [Spodoptera frugiperda]
MNIKSLVLCAFLAVTAAAPEDIQLIEYNVNNNGLGDYNFDFEQSDGTGHSQYGELRNPGSENEFVAVKGYYSWTAPDGNTFVVHYIADEKGFQPSISTGIDSVPPPRLLELLRSS